jgi:hypothetical protein
MPGPERGDDEPIEAIRGGLLVRDVFDGQLESLDGRRIGRVADLEAVWSDDGTLHIEAILVGPQVLLGRISYRLRGVAGRVLGERFLHRVPIEEVEELGPTVRLRKHARDYRVADGDRWVADHLLRYIPGNGRGPR